MLWDSAIFPSESVYDSLLNIEGRLADAIASTGNHPWRAYIISQTASLANKAELPSLDVNGEQIIGVWGSVQDASDFNVCRQMTLAQIQRANRQKTNTAHCIPVYWYYLDDLRVYHTRTNVIAQVCVYSRTLQQAALDANEAMLLPDVLAEALVAGTLSELFRDDQFDGQAQQYRQYFNEVESSIRQGLTSVISKATQPAMQATP